MKHVYFFLLVIFLGMASLSAEVRPLAVGAIGMNVSDMERSLAFYRDVLGFEPVADDEFNDAAYDKLSGVFGARVRIVRMRLGQEAIELTQYLTPAGRPLPVDSRSNDRWFQHIAIVVHDMDAAYAKVRKHRVQPVSTAPQTLPDWNPQAAGIRAFYFRDPDQHNLELIWFPPGKGDPKWKETTALFKGIDHTAIAVSDTEASLRLYRDKLGLRVVGGSENYGPEQEHLNHVFGARVRITTLRAPKGPGIEFLEYLIPRDGRLYPADVQPQDTVNWQTTIIVESAKPFNPIATAHLPLGIASAARLRDADGHILQLAER